MSPAIRRDEKAEAGGLSRQEGEPTKASHAYGHTSTIPYSGMDEAADGMQYGLMLMGPGASLARAIPKRATPDKGIR